MSANKIKKLRQLMSEKNIDYYYVPTRDAHNNEYVPSHWKRRAWLTDFTGSYGEALVGLEKAYLWTDPRYFLQAEAQLDNAQFTLMKQIQGVTAPVSAWLGENTVNAVVGVDPQVISMSQQRRWSDVLAAVHGELMTVPENLVDAIWQDQPPLQQERIQVLAEQYTGQSVTEKLKRVRNAMQLIGAQALVITQLDEIAWLFNVRGNDIPYNPLVISYAIITEENAFFFCQMDAVNSSDLSYFSKHDIALEPYDQFQHALQHLQGPVWLDPDTVSWWVALQLDQAIIIEKTSPIVMMKAIKNTVELTGAREAHRLDALAVVKFLHWIETHWRDGVDEITAADQLEKFRREETRCVDLSFPTICGFAEHGAIIHYSATPQTAKKIDDGNLLLLDSGGQYREGTTDITRTIHLGTPTSEQKNQYTRVLKGHLALRHAVFPEGMCGEHLNPIARLPLWAQGLDFGHGTGHGVGAYLCVHEGPQRISYGATGVPLRPGMIVSNEPGFYLAGRHGIRIENLCEIVAAPFTGFYTMADLTLVPYARNLLEMDLLSAEEKQWINTYHQTIYDLLAKDLSPAAQKWLRQATYSI